MADGSIKIDTDISVKKSEQRLKDLAVIAQNTGDKIDDGLGTSAKKFTNDWNIAKAGFDKNMSEMARLTSELDDATSALDISKSLGDTEGVTAITNEITAITSALEPLRDRTDTFAIKMEMAGNKAKILTDKIAEANNEMIETEAIANSLGVDFDEIKRNADGWETEIKKADDSMTSVSTKTSVANKEANKLEGGMKRVANETRSASSATNGISNGISKGIKSIGKYALALFGVRAVYSTLRRLSQQWLDSDDAGAQQVKANINAISSALSNALAPVITYVANLFMTVVGYANALLKAFFGIDLLSKKTAKNTNKVAGGVAKAKKEADKFSASFDKADVATSNIADNLDGAGGGGGMDLGLDAQIPEPDITPLLRAFEKAKKFFNDIFQSDTFKSVFSSLARIAGVTFESIKSIGMNVWKNIQISFDEMLPHIQRGLGHVQSFWTTMLSDVATATETWLPIITDSFNILVDDIFATFRPLTTFMAQLWADVWEIIDILWQEYGAPLLNKFGEFINNTIEIFTEIWAIVDTIISPILDFMKEVWDGTLKDLLLDIGRFVLDLIGYALDIYNKFIAPIVKWLLQTLQPMFAIVFGTIGGIVTGVFNAIFGTISAIINTIRGILSGLIQFIKGVFSGDWKMAWEGVVKIFSSIWDGIVALAKIPLNFVIDGINGFIRGLNKIKIPSWVPIVGGKGFNIGQIPRLAKGGELREPTLNIAGEYAGARTNPEIVTPQNIMRETFEDTLQGVGGYGNGGTQVIQLVVSGDKLAQVINEENDRQNMITNGGTSFVFS